MVEIEARKRRLTSLTKTFKGLVLLGRKVSKKTNYYLHIDRKLTTACSTTRFSRRSKTFYPKFVHMMIYRSLNLSGTKISLQERHTEAARTDSSIKVRLALNSSPRTPPIIAQDCCLRQSHLSISTLLCAPIRPLAFIRFKSATKQLENVSIKSHSLTFAR